MRPAVREKRGKMSSGRGNTGKTGRLHCVLTFVFALAYPPDCRLHDLPVRNVRALNGPPTALHHFVSLAGFPVFPRGARAFFMLFIENSE